MRIDSNLTDELVLKEIGARIARVRLDKNLTQVELTTQAGIGLKTLQRLEAGQAGTQLSSFIRILRALGILEQLETFLPSPKESPIAMLKLKSKQRQRASKPTGDPANNAQWTWGE